MKNIENVWKHLSEKSYFTAITEREPDTVLQKMPEIDNPLDFLSDIYNVKDFYPNEKEKPKTRTMKWCVDNARKK